MNRRRRSSAVSPNLQPEGTLRVRYRVRFAKTGLLRWIGHRDLATLWERIGRRVELPFSMTEGFNSKPRLMFPSALPLGVESEDEVLDLELSESWDADKLLAALQDDQQPGLTILSVESVDLAAGKAKLAATDYRVSPPSEIVDEEIEKMKAAIASLKAQKSVSIERKGKTVTAEVATDLPVLDLQNEHLVVRITAGSGASLKIHDVLDLLGLGDWPERGGAITRSATLLHGDPRIQTTSASMRPPLEGESHPADPQHQRR